MPQDLILAPAHESRPAGFLTFTLHAHLPWVINHGTWPHGIEWLHEAAAETYLPLLRVFQNLERDGIALRCNLDLSPTLLEQLAHPTFRADFPRYLSRKVTAAREDEAFFIYSDEHQLAETARFWQRFYTQALDDFEALGQNITHGFRRFHDAGLINLITSAATHSYLPLLGTDESLRAQIRLAVDTHTRHIGSAPRGIWIPELGYRPAGLWQFPVPNADASYQPPASQRIGVEQALAESSLDFFFVDTHLIEAAQSGVPPTPRTLYQPYLAVSPTSPAQNGAQSPQSLTATAFPRDPRTGIQVWSPDNGYPGDPEYLDFHKKRFPGGHRYWRVTGGHVDIADKLPWQPERAAERVQVHANHFVHLVYEALKPNFDDQVPAILCAPFDAELFGHWWFEGPEWLEAVARVLHQHRNGLPIELSTCAAYLDSYPATAVAALPEGSWGAEGNDHVWMNAETSWTYTHIYPAELLVRDLATADRWRESPLVTRILQQLCRELLLLESSDWQFLITTGAARDYAEVRFLTHHDQFNELAAIYRSWETDGAISTTQEERLATIEERDNIFPNIDPSLWTAGAHATRPEQAQKAKSKPNPSSSTKLRPVARSSRN